MPVFDYEYVLLDASLKCSFGYLFKKRCKFPELSNFSKFVLEEFPDVVRFKVVGLARLEEDLILHGLVVFLRVVGEAAHGSTLQIAIWYVFVFREHFE